MGAFRLELALAQRKNDVEQKFTDITYLDGSRSMARPVSNYQSDTVSRIDDLTTRTLSLNAYYDFSRPGSRFTPYLGAGVGVSFVELSGVYFEARYSCKDPGSDCDMPEQYDGRQNEDLTDTVLSAHLHAGLDYRVSEKMLVGITYLDGSRSMARPVSNYQSDAVSRIDDLTTRTLSLNLYYDFSRPGSRFTPYLGAGVGVSFVELSGVYFEARYSCKDPGSDCDMPEQYDGRQNEDLTDTVLSAHLHAGLDYRVSERMLVGVKLTYSMVGDMEAKGGYDFHPVAGIGNTNEITGMNHFSLMLGVKYFFGE